MSIFAPEDQGDYSEARAIAARPLSIKDFRAGIDKALTLISEI